MGYCPNEDCPHFLNTARRAEFTDGVVRCSDCGSALIVGAQPEPPELESARADDLVTLERYGQSLQAHMAQSKLAAGGIEAVVVDDHIVDVNALYAPAVGWVKVRVRASDVAAAREMLARDDSSDVAAIDPSTFAVSDRDESPADTGPPSMPNPAAHSVLFWILLSVGALIAMSLLEQYAAASR